MSEYDGRIEDLIDERDALRARAEEAEARVAELEAKPLAHFPSDEQRPTIRGVRYLSESEREAALGLQKYTTEQVRARLSSCEAALAERDERIAQLEAKLEAVHNVERVRIYLHQPIGQATFEPDSEGPWVEHDKLLAALSPTSEEAADG